MAFNFFANPNPLLYIYGKKKYLTLLVLFNSIAKTTYVRISWSDPTLHPLLIPLDLCTYCIIITIMKCNYCCNPAYFSAVVLAKAQNGKVSFVL